MTEDKPIVLISNCYVLAVYGHIRPDLDAASADAVSIGPSGSYCDAGDLEAGRLLPML